MESKIQKWGNSQGVRFPLEVLRKAQLYMGDSVEIEVKNGSIVVKPLKKKKKYKLKDLLARMPSGNEPYEVDWGKKEGKEEW
jgi:antitoxin MazE